MRDVRAAPLPPRLDKPAIWEPVTPWSFDPKTDFASLEEVALAAAADTTARIRAAAASATPSGRREESPRMPWALVPMPLCYWDKAQERSLERSSLERSEREDLQTLRRHREELQKELADLRGRLQELEDTNKRLEQALAERQRGGRRESTRLQAEFSSELHRLEDAYHQLEQDNARLKKALHERERGEASLQRLLEEERSIGKKVAKENARLRKEVSSLRELREEETARIRASRETRRSSLSSSSTGGAEAAMAAMIEVDLTSELA